MPHTRMGGQRAVLARMGKYVQSGWFIQGDEQSNQSRRALIAHNLTANIMANLIGGNFFTGLLIILQADDGFVGLVTMLTFGANLLQLLAPYILERFERRKPLLITLKIIIHLINIVFVGLIPYVPGAVQGRLVLLGFSILIVNSLNAFLNPGMTVWHIAHVPPKVRVQYFSLVSMLNGVFVALFNLLGSITVDAFRAAGQELWGLQTLRILALLISVVDVWMLTRIKELPQQQSARKLPLRDLFSKPWKQRIYLRSVLVVVVWSIIVNMPGSFYSVYLLRELNVGYTYIMTIASFNVVVLMLFTPLWRRAFLKHNWLKPLYVAIFLLAPHYFVLAFVSKGLLLLYPVGVIWSFMCSSGINLAFSSVAYINLPEGDQTVYIGFYSTANFMAALAAATIARTFVTSLQGLRFTLLGVQFGEKQLLMMVVGTLMFGVGMGVRRVYRKNLSEGVDI